LRQLTRLKTCKAVVNVGEYQLWSNKTQRIPSIWLPGFTFPNGGSQSSLTPHTTDKILGYISSLHPSKGFHLLASKWASIEKVLPELTLEVIGGLNLYQTTKVDPEIPTSPTYAKEIRTKFGGQVPANVKFLGLIPNPVGHVIQRWSISIMNPSGIGESDPVVVRDCLAEGVPIIGPMRFGLIDYMRHWPELVIGRGRKIDRVLEEFFSNDTLRNELRNRALELHQCYLARSKSSLDGWVNLVNSVAARDYYAIRSSGLEVRVPSISERYSLALGAVETSLLRWSEKLQHRFRPLGQLIGFLREKIR
jgi:glycosyltransferase involved in cell wall biosynthesis